jgi:hypothetical protein
MSHDSSPYVPQIHASTEKASTYKRRTMATKKTLRTREAQNRRRQLAKSSISIPRHGKLRTLKRSARKQLENERIPRLWVLPSVEQLFSCPKTFVYPRASLLGLPVELRQQILYGCYTVNELTRDLEDFKSGVRERLERVAWLGDMARWQKILQFKVKQYSLDSYEAELATVLRIKVAFLGRTSPFIHKELQYVKKRWQQDIEAYVDQRLKEQQERFRLLASDARHENVSCHIMDTWIGRKNGAVILAKEQRSSRKHRPQKCWYCMERHACSDPMCPMERRDPERWQQMTRVVGGWRAEARAVTVLQANGVVFKG